MGLRTFPGVKEPVKPKKVKAKKTHTVNLTQGSKKIRTFRFKTREEANAFIKGGRYMQQLMDKRNDEDYDD